MTTSDRPEDDADYVASLHKMAADMGLDPRVFQSVRMSDPRCDDCREPGPRYFCRTCPKDEIAPGVQTRRCGGCAAKHAKETHGIDLPGKVCAGVCKKELGHSPPAHGPAGQPWCGECSTWWTR